MILDMAPATLDLSLLPVPERKGTNSFDSGISCECMHPLAELILAECKANTQPIDELSPSPLHIDISDSEDECSSDSGCLSDDIVKRNSLIDATLLPTTVDCVEKQIATGNGSAPLSVSTIAVTKPFECVELSPSKKPLDKLPKVDDTSIEVSTLLKTGDEFASAKELLSVDSSVKVDNALLGFEISDKVNSIKRATKSTAIIGQAMLPAHITQQTTQIETVVSHPKFVDAPNRSFLPQACNIPSATGQRYSSFHLFRGNNLPLPQPTFTRTATYDINNSSVLFELPFCDNHRLEAKVSYFFCYHCNADICNICAQTDHRGHRLMKSMSTAVLIKMATAFHSHFKERIEQLKNELVNSRSAYFTQLGAISVYWQYGGKSPNELTNETYEESVKYLDQLHEAHERLIKQALTEGERLTRELGRELSNMEELLAVDKFGSMRQNAWRIRGKLEGLRHLDNRAQQLLDVNVMFLAPENSPLGWLMKQAQMDDCAILSSYSIETLLKKKDFFPPTYANAVTTAELMAQTSPPYPRWDGDTPSFTRGTTSLPPFEVLMGASATSATQRSPFIDSSPSPVLGHKFRFPIVNLANATTSSSTPTPTSPRYFNEFDSLPFSMTFNSLMAPLTPTTTQVENNVSNINNHSSIGNMNNPNSIINNNHCNSIINNNNRNGIINHHHHQHHNSNNNMAKMRDHSFAISVHTTRRYDRIHRPVAMFAREGDGATDLCRPWGVCHDRYNHIIVADRSNNRIQIFRADGIHVRSFGRHGQGAGEFNRPAGVDVDRFGRLVVADKDNHRIQVLTMEGEFLFAFGERGTANGKFHYPWDVACSTNGWIAVTDTRNRRVQIFDSNGMFVKKCGFDYGSNQWKHLDQPRGICFSSETAIIVTDFNQHRLIEVELARMPKVISAPGFRGKMDLFRPQGVAMDGEGNVLVADCRNNRIQVFRRSTGQCIGMFGVAGKECGQFDRPSDVTCLPDGKIVVVDYGNHRLQVF